MVVFQGMALAVIGLVIGRRRVVLAGALAHKLSSTLYACRRETRWSYIGGSAGPERDRSFSRRMIPPATDVAWSDYALRYE